MRFMIKVVNLLIMFDDFENIYPQKPDLVTIPLKDRLKKNVIIFVALATVLIFNFQESGVMLLSLFFVILIHEIGHFVGMKIFGFKDSKIMYFPFLSDMIKQKTEFISQKQRLITLLFGPLPGIIIGTLMLQYYILNPQSDVLLNLATIFLGVNLVSLLPLDPLDGGKIIQTMFFHKVQSFNMYFVLMSSILWIGVGYFTDVYLLIIFGFMMALKVRSIQKNIAIHDELEEQNVDYEKTYKTLTNREYWKIRSVFLENNPKIKAMIPSGDALWENERLLIEQISQILKIKIKKDSSILFNIVIFLIISVAIYFPVNMVMENWDIFADYIERNNV